MLRVSYLFKKQGLLEKLNLLEVESCTVLTGCRKTDIFKGNFL